MDKKIQDKAKAQLDYCNENRSPLFAPEDGVCFRCKKNIYSDAGYSLEEASSKIITGCPYCHYSFVS